MGTLHWVHTLCLSTVNVEFFQANTFVEIFEVLHKMSTWRMMAIGGICAFQIGSLCQLGNQDMAAKCLVCSPGS